MDSFVESKLITLNSADATRRNGAYLSDVVFLFRDLLRVEKHIRYSSIIVESVEACFSLYNVNVNNQTLRYAIIEGGGTTNYTATIPEGNYNAGSFIVTFAAQILSTSGKAVTLAIDNLTGRYALKPNDNSFSIKLMSEQGGVKSTCFNVLGMNETRLFQFPSGGNLATSFDNPCNFLGVKSLRIFSEALSSRNCDSNTLGQNSLITSIAVNAPSFGLIQYEGNQSNENILTAKTINAIDIKIKDEYGSLVDFNSMDWSISLRLKTYRNEPQEPDNEFQDLLNLERRDKALDEIMKYADAPITQSLQNRKEEAEAQVDEYKDDDLEMLLGE